MTVREEPNRENRARVLWLGDAVPQAVWRHVGTLPIQAVTADDLARFAPTSRLLIIPIPAGGTDAQEAYGALVMQARDHGLRVALVPSHGLSPEEQMGYYRAANTLGHVEGVSVLYDIGDALLHETQQAPLGWGADRGLRLTGDVPEEVSVQLLLQRAFQDSGELQLEAISEGKSGAQVWLVHRRGKDGRTYPLPLLVKVAELNKIRLEGSSAKYVAELIPCRSRANLHPPRCVDGATHGLLVYDFFNNAIRFEEAVKASPAVVLASLLGVTLRHCLEEARETHGPVAQQLRDMKSFRLSEALHEAAEFARSAGAQVPRVEELDLRWKALPALTHRSGPVHGDLHAGNLFAVPNSSDVLIIDFGSFRFSAPVCVDLACLEVSLVFPQGQGARTPEVHGRIRSWYEGRTPAPGRGSLEHSRLQDVVRTLRQEACQIEPNETVLALAQAAYLVRYASYQDSGALEERALAYELACTLLTRVEAGLVTAGV